MSKQIVLSAGQMRSLLDARRRAAGGMGMFAQSLDTTYQNLSPMINQGKHVSRGIAKKSGFELEIARNYILAGKMLKCDVCQKPEIDPAEDVARKITRLGEYAICEHCELDTEPGELESLLNKDHATSIKQERDDIATTEGQNS